MKSPSPAALQARNTLLYLFLGLMLLDLLLITLAGDLWALIRILLAAVLMYFVMRGYRWAKWLLVGLLSLLVVALVGLGMLLGPQLSLSIALGSVVLGVLCCVVMAYMLGNQPLAEYFSWYRRHRDT